MATKKKPTQLDRIESKLDTLLSGATFMRELDKAKEEPKAEGLQPGDYTDASKEVADALTAMGWEWYDKDRYLYGVIRRPVNDPSRMINFIKESQEATHLTPSKFLSRAAVTAKEIGLVPVVEPWVPKVGDWVVVLNTHTNHDAHGTLVNVSGTLEDYAYWSGGGGSFKSIRPATDAEIAAHLAEQEARKPVEFGTRVEYDGKEWRVVHGPDTHGYFTLIADLGGESNGSYLRRESFTVIDPQP